MAELGQRHCWRWKAGCGGIRTGRGRASTAAVTAKLAARGR